MNLGRLQDGTENVKNKYQYQFDSMKTEKVMQCIAEGLTSLAALAQKAQSAFKHVIQLHLGASGAVKYAEQVEFEPKWADSIPPIFGAWLEASMNTTDKITRKKMIPVIETSINLLLPYLSTKHMLTMEPTAFRPEVMRESANATEFEANPANCTLVGA